MAAGNVGQVSLFVCAVVEALLALILVVIVGVQLGKHDHGPASVSSTTASPQISTGSILFSSTTDDDSTESTDSNASDAIPGELRAYYSVTLAILIFYIFLSLLILFGIKAEMKDLVKSHLDTNVLLSLLTVIVYILAVSSSTSISKYFVALMAFFLVLRIVTITLEIRCHYRQGHGSSEAVSVGFVGRSGGAHVSPVSEVL